MEITCNNAEAADNPVQGRTLVRKGPKMPHTFILLRLLKSEMDQLELLRQLEIKLKMSAPCEHERIQQKIDLVMDEISILSRKIQDLKANRELATQS